MPSEPFPWDRKDLAFKDRKLERTTFCNGGSGGNYTPRWRDSPRPSSSSYHRQNESFYDAYSPSRSDEGFRSSYARYNGIRLNSKENRRRSPYDGYLISHVTSQRSAGELHDDQRLDQVRDMDHSLGTIAWKPLKWRSQSLVRVEEAGKGELEVSVLNSAVEKSPNLTVDSEDGAARKKTKRLSWGQGLAMYEKKKVDGSMNSESSLKAAGPPGSTSPATPCSAAAYLSPGIADRPFSNAKDIDKDATNHTDISDLGPPNCLEFPNKLDQLPLMSMLSALLNDLLEPEDACTGDSTFTRYTATSKLLLFKADISKELEKTECEIDLLENELKSLNNDIRCNPSQISFLLQNESSSMSCPTLVDASSKVSSDLTPVISSAMPVVKQSDLPICSSGKHESEVHANNDIPQTASSSNDESSSSGNEEQPSHVNGEREMAGNVCGDLNHSDGGSSSNTNFIMRSHENMDINFIDLIIASNRDAARRASHNFDKALPTASQQFDIWGLDKILLCRKNDMQIREKLALRKHQIKFKERVLALKFRAFNHLWKEDLRLLSARKQRTKSQQRFELCGRSSQYSMQKHRSSVRSRFTLPAGNLTLVPTADVVDFTSKLLSESQIKMYRNNLKMPALIMDEKERDARFINNNNLIEDPVSLDVERSMINPWNQQEKEVFMEKLATLGKDFAKISSFLSHKTTSDCVEFYYKKHKSESFRDVKKQLDLRKQYRCLPANTYMVTSGKKWNNRAVLTGEAVSSSVTSSMNCATIEEEDTHSDEACGEVESVDWTSEEKFLFIQALGTCGKDFGSISHRVGTKSREECKTFFSKARKCLKLDQILQGAGNGGGSSDADGGCAAETDSVICSTQSCSNQDDPRAVLNADEKVETEGENLQSKYEPIPSQMPSSEHNVALTRVLPDPCSISSEPFLNLYPQQYPLRINMHEKEHRAGDVKLFGQIITKSPSQNGSYGQSGLEDVALQSYGYWDGKRIQTGLSSLPPESSAIMVAAYQGSMVTGKPFFSTTKDIVGASGSNGLELVSGLQQQGRTAMARLSDPVVALKMANLWKQDLNGT